MCAPVISQATMNSPENDPPSAATDDSVFGEPASADDVLRETPIEVQLSELQSQLSAMSDAFLRAKAEAENTRRRADEEMSKARKYAIESFAESLLPVMDSLEAAIAQPEAGTAQVLEGVHATLRQLAATLERNKVIELAPPPGTKFDPHQHQAISVVPAEQEANTVVTVLQKGYRIADRVLRPALVTVAAAK